MARGVNKAIIVGNLGNDPEQKATTSGMPVTNVSVATSEAWKDKNTGEQQERTEWHRIVFFNRLAEIAGQYLKKGSKVYIEGRIQTRKWQDKDNQDRYTTEIVANEMQMLDSKGSNAQNQVTNDYDEFMGKESVQESQPVQAEVEKPEFDDDIPF